VDTSPYLCRRVLSKEGKWAYQTTPAKLPVWCSLLLWVVRRGRTVLGILRWGPGDRRDIDRANGIIDVAKHGGFRSVFPRDLTHGDAKEISRERQSRLRAFKQNVTLGRLHNG